ncbi:acetylornithine deacetylase [Parashewanella curva]|uniref:Acetylornithine deacetylase n=1 Tax=Parashewanella curva TaxID=2338552 RepID=A0A3L8PT41_9GAMM|nr:acetylornithine deacetylase [Parashewanella curva]RLV58506.1 acetylornithine deacetylase [Parashewanella curva]
MSLPNFEQSLSQLIAIPSISSNLANEDQSNHQVISLLATWFESLGFTIEVTPVPNTRNKFNLLAKLGSGEGGLLLAGHSDTVAFDEIGWNSDPHKVKRKGGRLYGLGTCDMKGFFAFILQACQGLSVNKLTKPLYILATADEETTMAGARFFSQSQDIRPDAAIIGEPTNLKPVIMHKGYMSHKITVTGKSGHSSRPSAGINAIEIMHQVIGKLINLKSKLGLHYQNQAFDVQEPTLNLGVTRGGDSVNRICGQCELDIDIRSLPSMEDEEIIYWLTDALASVVEQYPGRIRIQELEPSSPSFHLEKNSNLAKLAEQLSHQSCCAVNYATEAPFIQKLASQTIVLGPGSIDQAHQPNEFLAEDQINTTLMILTQLINKYCLTQET